MYLLRIQKRLAALHPLPMGLILIPLLISNLGASGGDIRAMKTAYESVQFEAAIKVGKELLRSEETLTLDNLILIHQYTGLSYYNLGQIDSSRSHFLSLLSLSPDIRLDPVNTSPKILDFFSELKQIRASAVDDLPAAFKQYILIRDRRPGAAWRSALIPGWGQFHKGHSIRGIFFGTLFWGSLTGIIVADAREGAARRAYLAAGPEPGDIDRQYDSYNFWYKTRRRFLVSTIASWAINLGDAILMPSDNTSLDISIQDGFLISFGFRF